MIRKSFGNTTSLWKYITWSITCIFFLPNNLLVQINPSESWKPTKLLAGTTALVLPKGQTVASSVDLLYHTIDISISDNVNLGAGLVYFPKFIIPTGVFKLKLGLNVGDDLCWHYQVIG